MSGVTDESTTVFDDGLVGTWRDPEDGVRIVLAPEGWKTYGVAVAEGERRQRFTGRLTDVGSSRLFELTIPAGSEPDPALVPVHILGRLVRRDDTLVVELLDHDWFRARVRSGAKSLPLILDERETVLVTASRAQLRRWLAANASAPMFSVPRTLMRAPGTLQ
jgi:hypothetical protein